MFEPMKHEEFLRLIETLDEQQKRHFRESIEILIQCYGSKPTMQALLLYKPIDHPHSHVISSNCNDMDATEMLMATTAYFEFITTRDAPPKEQFN
jgi:hypothetical protein